MGCVLTCITFINFFSVYPYLFQNIAIYDCFKILEFPGIPVLQSKMFKQLPEEKMTVMFIGTEVVLLATKLFQKCFWGLKLKYNAYPNTNPLFCDFQLRSFMFYTLTLLPLKNPGYDYSPAYLEICDFHFLHLHFDQFAVLLTVSLVHRVPGDWLVY